MRYTVILEHDPTGELIFEAVSLHIDYLCCHGDLAPQPSAVTDTVHASVVIHI